MRVALTARQILPVLSKFGHLQIQLWQSRLVAEQHVVDMATTNFFNHYSQNGSSPYDRITAEFPSVRIAGELIAAGFISVRGLLAQFTW